MHRSIIAATLASAAALSHAQTTVDYMSTGWTDFGTTDVIGVTGNFLPGWTTLTATPDLGDDVFGVPTQSLSGDNDDAAIWLNHNPIGTPGEAANESVRLSLSGFSIGQTYSLDFYATVVFSSFSGWVGTGDALDVAISGADISDWDSTILNDLGDFDNMNDWIAQSIVFTATSSIVEFDFGANAAGPDIGTNAYRYGIDGFSSRIVPAPAPLALLLMSAASASRRRRN